MDALVLFVAGEAEESSECGGAFLGEHLHRAPPQQAVTGTVFPSDREYAYVVDGECQLTAWCYEGQDLCMPLTCHIPVNCRIVSLPKRPRTKTAYF